MYRLEDCRGLALGGGFKRGFGVIEFGPTMAVGSGDALRETKMSAGGAVGGFLVPVEEGIDEVLEGYNCLYRGRGVESSSWRICITVLVSKNVPLGSCVGVPSVSKKSVSALAGVILFWGCFV
jgi:hypothetical protein